MSLPATEIFSSTVKAPAELEDETSDTRQTLHKALDMPKSLSTTGELYWGRRVEAGDEIHAMLTWKSLADHEAFKQSADWKPFLGALGSLLASPPTVFHVQFASSINGPASAPVTEMIMLYLPTSFANSELDAPYKAFADAVIINSALSISAGWVIEEQEHSSLGDAKGKAFVIAVGWESVDKNTAYRESQKFKDTMAPLQDLSSGISVWHVKYNVY